MHTTLVLAIPDFILTFILKCDVVEIGLGVVLMREGAPFHSLVSNCVTII